MNTGFMSALIVFGIIFTQAICDALGQEIRHVTVKTTAPENRNLKVFYRVPKQYTKEEDKLYRVMVLFGGRNCDGERLVAGNLVDFADANDIFTVAPSFKNDGYWDPEKWSGHALLNALSMIEKQYPIRKDRIIYCGYSAGSQASNLFAAWKPEICIAWVSHGCGVWHKPSVKMQDVPGLATCGEADIGRYELTKRFAMEARKKGEPVIWKSYPNTPHDVHPDAMKLTKVFLEYHHLANAEELLAEKKKLTMKTKHEIQYVGDDQEGRYWKAGDKNVKDIDVEDKVNFYSKKMADAWGKEARKMN